MSSSRGPACLLLEARSKQSASSCSGSEASSKKSHSWADMTEKDDTNLVLDDLLFKPVKPSASSSSYTGPLQHKWWYEEDDDTESSGPSSGSGVGIGPVSDGSGWISDEAIDEEEEDGDSVEGTASRLSSATSRGQEKHKKKMRILRKSNTNEARERVLTRLINDMMNNPAPDDMGDDDDEHAPKSIPRQLQLSKENLKRFERMSPKEMEAHVPVDDQGRLTSIGSVLHESGNCSPCAFAQTCPKRILCRNCHMRHTSKERHAQRVSQRPRKGRRQRFRKHLDRLCQQVEADLQLDTGGFWIPPLIFFWRGIILESLRTYQAELRKGALHASLVSL